MTLSYWDTWHNIIIIKNIISIFLVHFCYQAALSNAVVQDSVPSVGWRLPGQKNVLVDAINGTIDRVLPLWSTLSRVKVCAVAGLHGGYILTGLFGALLVCVCACLVCYCRNIGFDSLWCFILALTYLLSPSNDPVHFAAWTLRQHREALGENFNARVSLTMNHAHLPSCLGKCGFDKMNENGQQLSGLFS